MIIRRNVLVLNSYADTLLISKKATFAEIAIGQ